MSGRWTAWLHVKTEVRRWPGRGGATAPRDLYSGRCGSRVVDRCSSSVRRSWLAAAATTLSEAEISLREPGSRNKNTCSLSQPFPHRSAITSRCRKTRTGRQNLHSRLRVRTPDSPRERRPWLARAKTSEKGEECRADTRCRHAQRASRTALDIGREGGCPAPSGYLLSPGRAVQLGRLL